jgi:hypothetical protein
MIREDPDDGLYDASDDPAHLRYQEERKRRINHEANCDCDLFFKYGRRICDCGRYKVGECNSFCNHERNEPEGDFVEGLAWWIEPMTHWEFWFLLAAVYPVYHFIIAPLLPRSFR